MKPFFYLFVIITFVSTLSIAAQDMVFSDSLDVPAKADTTVIASDSTTMRKGKKEPPFKTRIKYQANDSVKLVRGEQKVFLYNEGQVNYEDVELKAYETEFDMTTKNVYANGGKDSVGHDTGLPVFKQGNETFDARSLSYNFGSSKGVIHQIKTQQGEGYMHAGKSKRFSDGHIDMAHGKYTTCDADHPHFYLALSKAKVMPGDKVVFGPANLVLLDIPLPLFVPFGFFPYTNKKSVSGVLPPSIGMEATRGMNLTNGGYYFAFNDHLDATIRGDIYTTGTWKVNLASRYLMRYKYSGNLNLNYGENISGEKGLDYSKTTQYSLQWTHTQDAKANPNNNFSASVNFSTTSYDREFDLYNPVNQFTNTKSSSISYRQGWPNSPFRLTANMNHSQNSQNKTVQIIFPTATFSMDRIYPFRKKESAGKTKWFEDIGITYDAQMQNTLTGTDGEVFNEKNFKNMQNGFKHSIPLSINFKALKFFNITPSMGYTGVLYTSQLKKYYETETSTSGAQKRVLKTDTIRGLSYTQAFSPTISVSANPKFYLTNVYKPGSKIQAIRTVISPTASISYTPDMNEIMKNRAYKTYTDSVGIEHSYSIYDGYIYGTPSSPGQSGSVSVGINGNVEMKVRSDKDTLNDVKKIKILDRIDARSSYNMFADSLNWTPVSLSASTTIAGINLNVTGAVDPYAINSSGQKYNKFGPRLTSVGFNTGISLPFQKKESKDSKESEDKGTSGDYSYFDIPWNLSISYSMNYSKPTFDGKFTQNLNFSGNVTLTPKWSISFNSAYDFDAKKISFLTSTIQRDLHCWTMSLTVTPFGPSKSFFFQINVKSSMLQDLKYEKRKSPYDYTQW